MTRQVTIPLEWANNIPGVAGVDDVVLEVVEADDVVDPVVDEVPDKDDNREAADEAIDSALADGVLADVDETLNVDVPGAEAVADAVLDRLDLAPGLFGPIDDPFDEVIRRAVRSALEDLPELDVDLGALDGEDLIDLPDVVDDLIDDVDGLIDDVTDGLVSDEARQDLEDSLE